MRDDYSWRIAVGVILSIPIVALPYFLSESACDLRHENIAACYRNWMSAIGQFLFSALAAYISYLVYIFTVRIRKLELLKQKRDDINNEEEYVIKISRTFMKLRGDSYHRIVKEKKFEIYSDIVEEIRFHFAFIEARQRDTSSILLEKRRNIQKMLLVLALACQNASEAIEKGEAENEYATKTKAITPALSAAIDAFKDYRKEIRVYRIRIEHQLREEMIANTPL